MAGESPLYTFPTSGAAINTAPVTTAPGNNIDWRSIIGLLGNKSNQQQQLPMQPLQVSQFSDSNVQTGTLKTPQMFPEQSEGQSSFGDVEQWAKFIAMLFG